MTTTDAGCGAAVASDDRDLVDDHIAGGQGCVCGGETTAEQLEIVLDDLDGHLVEVTAVARTRSMWLDNPDVGRARIAGIVSDAERAADLDNSDGSDSDCGCGVLDWVRDYRAQIADRRDVFQQIGRICDSGDSWDDWRDGVGMILAAVSSHVRHRPDVTVLTPHPRYL